MNDSNPLAELSIEKEIHIIKKDIFLNNLKSIISIKESIKNCALPTVIRSSSQSEKILENIDISKFIGDVREKLIASSNIQTIEFFESALEAILTKGFKANPSLPLNELSEDSMRLFIIYSFWKFKDATKDLKALTLQTGCRIFNIKQKYAEQILNSNPITLVHLCPSCTIDGILSYGYRETLSFKCDNCGHAEDYSMIGSRYSGVVYRFETCPCKKCENKRILVINSITEAIENIKDELKEEIERIILSEKKEIKAIEPQQYERDYKINRRVLKEDEKFILDLNPESYEDIIQIIEEINDGKLTVGSPTLELDSIINNFVRKKVLYLKEIKLVNQIDTNITEITSEALECISRLFINEIFEHPHPTELQYNIDSIFKHYNISYQYESISSIVLLNSFFHEKIALLLKPEYRVNPFYLKKSKSPEEFDLKKNLTNNNTYNFGKLIIKPCIDQDGKEYLKVYADNSIQARPVSSNTLTIHDY